MPDAGEDKALLARVLGKVNDLPPGDVGVFSAEEIQLLRGVIASRKAATLSARERGFIAHVQEVVVAHTAPPEDEAEALRRKNMLLRVAIDKCLQGRVAELEEVESALIQNTAARLDDITDPSESHLRLRGLVFEALRAIEIIRNATPETIAPLGADALAVVDAESFFEGGTRTRLREYAEIPLEINARVVEHEGDIEISGNVPDDVALIVKEGRVVVRGQCDGSILADGAIEVHGNIAGPWTVSTSGSIQCDRVLGGANLYAPHEKITCAAMERPGRIYSGVEIEVTQDVRGGTLIAPIISVSGALRGAQAQVMKSLICAHIEGDAREPAQVTFRNLLSALDYRMDVSDEAWHLAREVARFRFRNAVGSAMLACLGAEICNVQRARIFALSGKHGLDLKSLRTLQAKAAYLQMTIVIGELLEQVLLEAAELEGDEQATALISGTDEAQAAVKFLEREVAHLSDDLTREPKALVVSAAKHLANLAKKARDCAGNRPVLEECAHALLLRLTEWRDLQGGAQHGLGESADTLRAVVGVELYDTLDPAQLAHAVAEATHAAGAAANVPLLRSLKALAERYNISHSTYTHGAAEVATELARLEARMASERSIQLGEGRHGDRFVRAERFGPHVIVATSPGLAAPSPGGMDHEAGRVVRIDRELPGPATYRCDGLQVRRQMH